MNSLSRAAGMAALTILGSIFLAVSPAKASANLAFCLQYSESTQCDYATYAQCQASASGTGADCIANPDPRAIQSFAAARPSRRASPGY
jgi:Protein of unknown function (DUF3551)